MSTDWDEVIDVLDLVGGGRLGAGAKKRWLGAGAKKRWLIGGVEQSGPESEGDEGLEVGAIKGTDGGARVRTFRIEWGGMWANGNRLGLRS